MATDAGTVVTDESGAVIVDAGMVVRRRSGRVVA